MTRYGLCLGMQVGLGQWLGRGIVLGPGLVICAYPGLGLWYVR